MRTMLRETGEFVDPHTAVAMAVAEKESRDPSIPMVVLGTAHAAKFPDAVEAACGVRPPLPECLSDLARRSERVTSLPVDQTLGRDAYPVYQPRCARRSCCMSVDVTRLPSGLTVVTAEMPHLHTASLGVWVGSGSRDERPDEHGISHLLEHMAFKGTTRRTARQIAEEIEAVGGDLNAATSVETTAYYARVLRADVPLALDVLSDILSDPAFDPEELQREQNVIVQEIGAVEDTPDDLIWDRLQTIAFPDQPVGRSILGTPATVRSFDRRQIASYLTRNYCAPDMVVAAAGAVDHQAIVREVEQPLRQPSTGRRRRCPSRLGSSAARTSKPAISNRCMSRWRCPGCPTAIPG